MFIKNLYICLVTVGIPFDVEAVALQNDDDEHNDDLNDDYDEGPKQVICDKRDSSQKEINDLDVIMK